MTNAELIQKIRNEIERLKGIGGIVPLDNREQKTGYESALIDIEQFLSTLESEKPMEQEDLNDEIKKYIEEYGYEKGADKLLIAIVARHFARWGAEHSGSSEIPNDLEEAADEYANKHYSEWDESWDDYNGHNIEPENDKLQLMDAFIAGAKWMSIHGNDIKEL